jgi:hypothetical protein
MTTGSSWRAFGLGVRWGCGHSVGLIFMALIFFAAGQTVDLDSVGGYLNYVVGFFMIALGIWTGVHVRKKYQAQLKEGVQSLASGEGGRVDTNRDSRSSVTNLVELRPISQRRVSSAASPTAMPQVSLSSSSTTKEQAPEEPSASPSSSFHVLISADPAATEPPTAAKLHVHGCSCCRNRSFENPTTQKVWLLLPTLTRVPTRSS